MQSRQQWNQLWSEDWRQTRLCNVGDALQHEYWLDNEAHNRRSVTGHKLDPLLNARGPRFCRWSCLGLPYSITHAGKDDPTQHLRTASWPDDQPKEDISDTAERVQTQTSLSERRRPANDWRAHLPGQHNKAWWRSWEWHQEPSQQGQKRLQKLNNVWRSSQYSTKTRLKIYQSCVISTLLYGSECWRMTECDITKLSDFHTMNLRRIHTNGVAFRWIACHHQTL